MRRGDSCRELPDEVEIVQGATSAARFCLGAFRPASSRRTTFDHARFIFVTSALFSLHARW
jgi:hypothetical protein